MRPRVPAKRTKKRAPKPRREEWCTQSPIRVENPGLQRCPRCGRRVRAYPIFDDGLSMGDPFETGHNVGFDMKRMAPGTGAEAVRRELATGRGTKSQRLKRAAEQWWLGPHKLR
jgi:hypothetical protein